MSKLKECIAEGAAWLDTNAEPNWRDKIDFSKLNIAHTPCIIDQAMDNDGAWIDFYDALPGNESTGDYGFGSKSNGDKDDFSYTELEQGWKEYLCEVTKILKRVAKGIDYLNDNAGPNWQLNIDFNTLDVGGGHCIIDQAMNNKRDWLSFMYDLSKDEKSYTYGFTPHQEGAEDTYDKAVERLTLVWEEYITSWKRGYESE